MGFLKNLFGKSDSGKKEYFEKDNIGTRHETHEKASSYWLARNMHQKFEPFIMYVFDNSEDARNAFLELDFIFVAKDTNKLVCRQPMTFGYYSDESGNYEAVLLGEDLTIEYFEKAKSSFEKYNGKLKNEQRPVKKAASTSKPKSIDIKKVKFVNKYSKQNPYMGTNTYEIYKGPDAATAKAFLETKPVTKGLYYIIVETPEGNYGRDIDGIYRE